MVSRDGAEPERRSAVRPLDAEVVAQRARRLSRRHSLGSVGPQAQHHRHFVDGLGDEVEGDEIAVRLRRRCDAALMRAEERFLQPRRRPEPSGVAARASFGMPAPASNPPAPARSPRREGPPPGANGQLIVAIDKRVDLVLDEIKSVARRGHGDAEQVAAARRLLRLVRIDPPRLDLVAAYRIDFHHLAVLGVDHQEMAVRRRRHRQRRLQQAVLGDGPADSGAVIAGRGVPDRADPVAGRIRDVKRIVGAKREAGRPDEEHILVRLRAEAAADRRSDRRPPAACPPGSRA